MPEIHEYDRVVLTQDLPETGFKAGDVGTVVLIHGDGKGYELEFFSVTGDTIDVATAFASQVRPAEESEVIHARKLVS